MHNALVELDSVSVCYPLEPLVERSIKDLIVAPMKRRGAAIGCVEAIRRVSFVLRPGDRLGIVGPNGAGKSTLLRAIAGIYPISEGKMTVRGRVNGLFDLGVGFEMHETGRTNIYLRGYLIGLSKKQIRSIEGEIVDFSGLGQFIDLPLKSYSAGMQVRLAFAISTAVQSEVLLIDEVIAAGDAEFQRRAKERFQAMIDKAQCMIMTSHDINSIRSFCSLGLWLDNGSVRFLGPCQDAANAYEAFLLGPNVAQDGKLRPLHYVRRRPMWLGVEITHRSEGVEIATSEVAWAFSAEFPLGRYLQHGRESAVSVRIRFRVIEGEFAIGIIDSSYQKIEGEERYRPGKDHAIELHADKAQHAEAIMFRNGSIPNRSRAVISEIEVVQPRR